MATIAKWGNSEAIRIPKEIREQTGLCEGSEVTIEADGGNIIIRPKTARVTQIGRYRVPNLSDVFADYQGDYQASEEGFGNPVGAEEI